ncbi:CbbQ/NirQ/NorQ/GpvN family protein [Hoeflea phototrophica]|nr:CbbQ/NirQ/NorQ/GpvN family protein [Hoeflea phototrophica]
MLESEPRYYPAGNELALYEAAYSMRLPVMLKGPTGCGKTRFVEHMAWRLQKPLVTVSCHEDMTAADLVGRFLLGSDGTYWQDGPLTMAVRMGAICYLDEVVEARQDTIVVTHSLTDDRRMLPLEKKGEMVRAHPDFQLVISYNPGYQSILKDLKESTKQRFCALDFAYPDRALEAQIVRDEGNVSDRLARTIVEIGEKSRNLGGEGLAEGASTRILVQMARLAAAGLPLDQAAQFALIIPLTDDLDIRDALSGIVDACLPGA